MSSHSWLARFFALKYLYYIDGRHTLIPESSKVGNDSAVLFTHDSVSSVFGSFAEAVEQRIKCTGDISPFSFVHLHFQWQITASTQTVILVIKPSFC